MSTHKWRQRGGVMVRRTSVSGNGAFRATTEPTPSWQSCERCGISDGMAKHMKWTECSQSGEKP